MLDLIPVFLCTVLILTSISVPAIADQVALGDDGREVLLKEDGSWEYIGTHRMATSEDGTRVRLKDDGSWEFVGNAPRVKERQVFTESLEINLDKVVTEFSKEKTGPKSELFRSQTIFYLELDVSSYGDGTAPNLTDFSLFNARDDRGTEYPVIAIRGAGRDWVAGGEHRIGVAVDGSPSGSIMMGSKKITLTIDRSVFGSDQEISFIERTSDIKKIRVEELSPL